MRVIRGFCGKNGPKSDNPELISATARAAARRKKAAARFQAAACFFSENSLLNSVRVRVYLAQRGVERPGDNDRTT